MAPKRRVADDSSKGDTSRKKIRKLTDHTAPLPVELIEYLFTFLDQYSLKNCCLVNKLFNEVIASSTKLMSRFTLSVNGNRSDWKEFSTLPRRYPTIEIRNLKREHYEEVFTKFQETGHTATRVISKDCDFPDGNQLLTCFPNVASLVLEDFWSIPEITEQSSLTKLEHLILCNEYNIRSFKHCKNLKLLSVPCGRESLEHLVQLLRNQTSLDTLELLNVTENFNLDLHPEFKVRRLSIVYQFNRPDLSDFVLQFVGRIDCLSLDTDDEGKTNKIVQNFTTSKTLRISCWVLDDANFYNTNQTELSIMCFTFSGTGLLGAFKIFPNLKHLTVAGTSDESLSDNDVKTFIAS